MSLTKTGSRVANPELHEQSRSRTRIAWIVLLSAFTIFLLLAITIPLSIGWYLEHATVAELAVLQGNAGVTRLEVPNVRDHVAIAHGDAKEDVVEGSVLRTDKDAQAVVTFFDRSSLTIFPNSNVTLKEMRKPRFGRSSQANRVVLLVDSGRVRVQVSPSSNPPIRFEVRTPQAPAPQGNILLYPGSYSIEVSNQITHLSVRTGRMKVKGQSGNLVHLQQNQRAEIPLGGAAQGPYSASRNLLINPNFESPKNLEPISEGWLAEGWLASSHQGDDGGRVNGTVDVEIIGSTRALHFKRKNSNNNHGETSVEQAIDRVISDTESLNLSFDVKLAYQSLSGGGEQSSEFPMIVRVDYQDHHGNMQHWVHGFYYQNPVGFPIAPGRGSLIPQNTWYRYEVDLNKMLENAHKLQRIRLYASGWDWDVYVSEIELREE